MVGSRFRSRPGGGAHVLSNLDDVASNLDDVAFNLDDVALQRYDGETGKCKKRQTCKPKGFFDKTPEIPCSCDHVGLTVRCALPPWILLC
jgi:hypothetical protein